ncbi:TPA: hypothetical protein EYO57_34920, partial [Candidatus Poribacteria bacterium]|nr:hypothetical protein [Candidatus Poribacteria bacterium]
LTTLDLQYNQLTELSGLANLTGLTLLDLRINQVSEVSPLANLTNLTKLWISNNQVSEVSPLVNLTSLTWLDLNNNRISDISPLVENNGIKGRIYLNNNPLSKTTILTHIPALKARGNNVNFTYPAGWDIIDIGDAPVDSVVFEFAAESVYVNSVVNVTVKLVDTQKRLIRGETVGLAVDIGTLGPLTDNGDGSFTTKYTAAETIGTAKITAVANNGKFASTTFYVDDIRVGISAKSSQLVARSDVMTDLTIQVTDTRDNLLKGHAIKLTTDLGIVSTPIDNGDGTFTAEYTAAEKAGTATITVETDDGKSASVSITLLDVADTRIGISAAKSRLFIARNDMTDLTIRVTDTRGILVKGLIIKLTADLGAVSTLTDNGDGTFSAEYTAGEKAGTATVIVEADNGKSASVTITLFGA